MRYIIINKHEGIFLGNSLNIQIFSNSLVLPIIKAYSFANRTEASEYADFVAEQIQKQVVIKGIKTKEKYIPIDVLIKSGYGKYTEKMLGFMPAISETIH
jgi:hypothetical protein